MYRLIVYVAIATVGLVVGEENAVGDCFDSSTTFNDLAICLSKFIAPARSFSEQDWQASLQTEQQRNDWTKLIKDLLSSDGSCQSIRLSASLNEVVDLKLFRDKFCVLYEKTLNDEGRFDKGWGIFVVPYRRNFSDNKVHISAAHPVSDGPVHLQAAAVFQQSAARSLVLSGLRRDISSTDSVCQPGNFRTDGAHDNRTVFHHTLIAVADWQLNINGGCPTETCAFVQFHGKAETSCVQDTAFVSAGYPGSSAAYLKVYSDPNLPANRLTRAFLANAPDGWTARTPAGSNCSLTAGTNIFGRLLNGVVSGRECGTKANPRKATGQFIHIEQAMKSREPDAYAMWSKCVRDTFTIA